MQVVFIVIITNIEVEKNKSFDKAFCFLSKQRNSLVSKFCIEMKCLKNLKFYSKSSYSYIVKQSELNLS
jgi:hypothetical protein